MRIKGQRFMKWSFYPQAPLAAVLAAALLTAIAAPAAAAPTLAADRATSNAPPGILINIMAMAKFDNAGTNPRITEAVFSDTSKYTSTNLRSDGIVFVQVKTNAELNAMSPRPDNPFTVTVELTMTNDEGETATGTITLETHYARVADGESSGLATPTLSRTTAISMPPAAFINIGAEEVFANAGTNPKLTDAVFSTTEYLRNQRVLLDRLWVHAKSAWELNAMPEPPESPFTYTAEVTMTNDAGQTATGTLTFETTYERNPNDGDPSPELPSEATMAPMFRQPGALNAAPGDLVTVSAETVLDNAGSNPRFTNAVFSTTAYYDVSRIEAGRLEVQAKSAADLNALPSPPESPFTVTVDVTLTNDTGTTVRGTLSFETTYARTSAAAPAGPSLQPGQSN